MSEKQERWVSRSLVKMLVNERRDYEGAAEVVSGSEDVFALCGQGIQTKIEKVEKEPSVVSRFELQQSLEEARHEIAGHEAWQMEVISGIPKQDDIDGVAGPLRLAFAKSANTREALLERVRETYKKYFTRSGEK
ncbi:MAG: hypothetical protein K8F91_17060 [Candidatus Obscuribacterales bacterium]|nr:hypothetical protein [Candidatus Obscuribacterales bacterium]